MAARTSTQCRGACARGGGCKDGSGSSSSSDGNDVGTPVRVRDATRRGGREEWCLPECAR